MKRPKFIMAAIALTATTTLGFPVQAEEELPFDAAYYAEAYPDVTNALGTDADTLYNHYTTYGQYEGRYPNADAAKNATATPPQTDVLEPDEEAIAVASTHTVTLNNWPSIEPCLTNAPAVDFSQPGSENLRELLKNIPMNEELREVVIRIGNGATWDNNTGYQPFNNGYNYTACSAYTIMCMDIVNGKDVNGWGNDTIFKEDITADTIQQYDYLTVPGTGTTHAVFVLYVDPTTGTLLTTEGNYNGTTRTGWNIWSWDKVIEIKRRATSAWWDDNIWF